MICNISNLDRVNINAYTKFGKILSIGSRDIEPKSNYDRIRNDGQPKTSTKQG